MLRLNQSDLAIKLGVGISFISQLERGVAKISDDHIEGVAFVIQLEARRLAAFVLRSYRPNLYGTFLRKNLRLALDIDSVAVPSVPTLEELIDYVAGIDNTASRQLLHRQALNGDLLGVFLRSARLRAGLSQKECASRLQYPNSANPNGAMISQIESGSLIIRDDRVLDWIGCLELTPRIFGGVLLRAYWPNMYRFLSS
jgi:transcriptional regulator with XRE-family HTH domain